jgi:hypothetical protein
MRADGARRACATLGGRALGWAERCGLELGRLWARRAGARRAGARRARALGGRGR